MRRDLSDLSDLEDAAPGTLCSCGKPAMNLVEWDSSKGFWSAYCSGCFDASMASYHAYALDADWSDAIVEDSLRARGLFGFCDTCGVRYESCECTEEELYAAGDDRWYDHHATFSNVA
jgi:hypothetical protein